MYIADFTFRRNPLSSLIRGQSFAIGTKNAESYDGFRQCLHNESDFPEPDRFNPDRFLGDSALNPSKIDPRDFAFGYGRR